MYYKWWYKKMIITNTIEIAISREELSDKENCKKFLKKLKILEEDQGDISRIKVRFNNFVRKDVVDEPDFKFLRKLIPKKYNFLMKGYDHGYIEVTLANEMKKLLSEFSSYTQRNLTNVYYEINDNYISLSIIYYKLILVLNIPKDIFGKLGKNTVFFNFIVNVSSIPVDDKITILKNLFNITDEKALGLSIK